ncbi:uncharacterized protein LOC118669665 isoform X2 [Myotis myotis]|uniref:uncharacterized protein LOC118669665 isoform X2 n=1 Tax=Myotis myotis TaxID=51298 RepID=UPI00174AEB96|nr:uncharacterized protein LOC118669665 isoform X2 [Myotis myotis]
MGGDLWVRRGSPWGQRAEPCGDPRGWSWMGRVPGDCAEGPAPSLGLRGTAGSRPVSEAGRGGGSCRQMCVAAVVRSQVLGIGGEPQTSSEPRVTQQEGDFYRAVSRRCPSGRWGSRPERTGHPVFMGRLGTRWPQASAGAGPGGALAPVSPPRRAGAHCSEGHTPFLHRKVFHKLRFCVSEGDIRKVVANTPGAIEPILCALKEKVVDGAVREDPPGAGVLVGAFDPGVSSADADGLWLGLATTPHAGLPSSPVPSGVKTLQSQRAEKTGHYACRGRGPAGGPREHLNTGVQQLLEEKEQALAILQETVQVWGPGWPSMPTPQEVEELVVGVMGRPCFPFYAAQTHSGGYGSGWGKQGL